MANTTGQNKLAVTPWTTDTVARLPAATPAAATTFYAAQAVMRDVSGNIVQCDDTIKGEFIGVLVDFVRTQVDTTNTVQVNGLVGDAMFDAIQPQEFTALIAAAAAGDEGKRVYWLYNNQVSYSPGTNGNYAGTVWLVKDSTHVVVRPPWVTRGIGPGGAVNSTITLAAGSAAIALTKWDVNRTFLTGATLPQMITLPPVASCSPGDRITFIYTAAGGFQVTIDGSGAETVNGAATVAMGVAQYSRMTVETDGTAWYIIGI